MNFLTGIQIIPLCRSNGKEKVGVRYDCCPDADESVGIPAEPDWELLSRWVGSVEVGKDHNIHIRPSF
jgi:hypothetical protein